MRKLLAIGFLAITTILAITIVFACSIFIRYGGSPRGNNYVETRQTIVYGKDKLDNAVVIYPANLVSVWQYQDIATKLSSRHRVIIVKSNLRLSTLPRVSYPDLQKSYPGIKTWVVVGHSAGSVQACNAVDSKVITVNGYCKKPKIKPSLAIIGNHDTLLNKDFERNADKVEVLSGGHFAITDAHMGEASHRQIIDSINSAL